ncbi:MAG: hypothetical protein NC120_13380 [Ruminococcus sp.]|nr:hypothetical protein [Ruminococcus sp.]
MDNLKNGNGVVTVCYGETREWKSREDAKKFFLEAMMNSEGSERERYSNVYFGIIMGFPICTDSG